MQKIFIPSFFNIVEVKTDLKSFIKLYGPGLSLAIEKLTEFVDVHEKLSRYEPRLPTLSTEEPHFVHSLKFGEFLFGEYDFAFSWNEDPTTEDVLSLIEEIDTMFLESDFNIHYSISTLKVPENSNKQPSWFMLPPEWLPDDDRFAVSWFQLIGPPLEVGLRKLNLLLHSLEKIHQGGIVFGRYDYAMVWKEIPTKQDIIDITKQIDGAFSDINVLYSLSTFIQER